MFIGGTALGRVPVAPRILLVDDDRGLLVPLAEQLSHDGFDVTTARNGEEALRRLDTAWPDLLIIDLLMPRMDGLTLAREIKAQYPGTVVTGALYEAGTDAEPWRQRGIPVYGLRPYPASAAVLEDMHGIDERVSIPGLNQGTDMVERILRAVAAG